MGYEARGNGEIMLNRKPEDIPAGIIDKGWRAFSEVAPSPDGGLWITQESQRYYEDAVLDFLTAIAPYTASGHIEFVGDDDYMWRFVWTNGEWQEQNGRIVWEPANRDVRHSERMEMLGCLTDIIEDWLESKGITKDDIPCADRDQAIEDGEDPDGCAMIYGEDYDHLTGSFEELLINCGLIEKEGH